ncbi:putative ABC transport system ATP-binding protein [Microbacterium phyllosphaerae]|uniref:ABC transport system ATP-binding protein n=1 Tax=Microbacterium phyllosphaerae TaxID=124798 RepID=A0ABS4WL21_9MICO|nr:ABC transporter ATP-binding protein [Microbacterium phyllosphaerae]MBP2376891.1 putative ABC transport system ATP-binding protein [Microbacterium phyllosphaerae]
MTAVVELREVSRVYAGPPEVHALATSSVTIDEGDFVTIVGPSGSGKSTLLNILGLLDKPTAGTYTLRGQDVTLLSENDRARVRGTDIGFVFQSFHLLEQRTCLENVMLSDLYNGTSERESRSRASEALEAVGLGSFERRLPTELSGGQQQRVAIARALAANPAVLLCDEPTGNLDSVTANAILALFDELNDAGRTVVLITHDAEVARYGNRTLHMLDGTLGEKS